MTNYEDLDTYTGYSEHDLWVTLVATKTPALQMFSMSPSAINLLIILTI